MINPETILVYDRRFMLFSLLKSVAEQHGISHGIRVLDDDLLRDMIVESFNIHLENMRVATVIKEVEERSQGDGNITS